MRSVASRMSSEVARECWPNLLTRQASLPIVPAMYGLNQICGICREIIR